MGAITTEQKKWIEGLICERVKKNENNIPNFENSLNPDLVEDFYNHGIEKDQKDEESYYYVKDNVGNILFFFSLKCGLLHEEAFSTEFENMCLAHAKEIPMTSEIEEQISAYQSDNSLSDKEMNAYLSAQYSKIRYFRKSTHLETLHDEQSNVHLVMGTYPAIEISRFCKNESTTFESDQFSGHRLGEIVFWFVLLEKVNEVLQTIGAEFLYLFAAGNELKHEKLIAYYEQKLKFNRNSLLGTNKPQHNSSCKFMCQNISDAMTYKSKLLENFNDDSIAERI